MVKIVQIGEPQKVLDQWARKVDRDLKNAAKSVQIEARSLAPVRTGNLRDMIQTEPCSDGYMVIAKAPYSGFLEYGTKRIRPVAFLRRALAKMILDFKGFSFDRI